MMNSELNQEELYQIWVEEAPAIILNLEHSFKNSKLLSEDKREELLGLLECMKLKWKLMSETMERLNAGVFVSQEKEKALGSMNIFFGCFTKHANAIRKMMENGPAGEEEIRLYMSDACSHKL